MTSNQEQSTMRIDAYSMGSFLGMESRAGQVFGTPSLVENILAQLPPRYSAWYMLVNKQFHDGILESERLRRRLFLPPGADKRQWWIIDGTSNILIQADGECTSRLTRIRTRWPFVENRLLLRPDTCGDVFGESSPPRNAGACMKLNIDHSTLLSLDPISSMWSMSLSQPSGTDVTVTWHSWVAMDDISAPPLINTTRIQSRTLTGHAAVTTMGEIVQTILRAKPARFLVVSITINGGTCVPLPLLRAVQATGYLVTPPLTLLLNRGAQSCYDILKRRNGLNHSGLERTTAKAMMAIEDRILQNMATKDFSKMVQVSKTFGTRMLRLPYKTFRPSTSPTVLTEFWVIHPRFGFTIRIVSDDLHHREAAFFAANLEAYEQQFNKCKGTSKRKYAIKRVVRINRALIEEVRMTDPENAMAKLEVHLVKSLGMAADSRGPMALTMPPMPIEVIVDGSWRRLHTIHKAGAVYDDLRFMRDSISTTPRIRIPGAIWPSVEQAEAAATAPIVSVSEMCKKFYPYHSDGATPKWEEVPRQRKCIVPEALLYCPAMPEMKHRTAKESTSGPSHSDCTRV